MKKIYEAPVVEEVSFVTEAIAIVLPDLPLQSYSLRATPM